MAQPEEPKFDKVANQFLEGYASQVNGYIRYRVIQANLLASLPELADKANPKRLIDVGAGDAREARSLASLGHKVVALDPSSTMIEAAKSQGSPELEAILQGDAAFALEQFGPGSFDIVMSHGVQPYLKDPSVHVKELAQLIKKGGYISLLVKGFDGTLLRYANQRKFDDMRAYLETGEYTVNRLGEVATAWSVAKNIKFLSENGLDLVAWFGVTILTDSIEDKIEDFDPQNLELLFEQELALSRNASTKGMGQMLHFLARKNY